jgi:predicted DNA-binding transcriptional regulator YafY
MIQDVRAMDVKDEKQKCLVLNEAITFKSKIKITYFSSNSGESERIIHPYAIITYKGAFYVAACHP